MLSIYYVDGWTPTPRKRGLLARLLPFLFAEAPTDCEPGEPRGRAVLVAQAVTHREASSMMQDVDLRRLRTQYGPGFLVATNSQGHRVALAPHYTLTLSAAN